MLPLTMTLPFKDELVTEAVKSFGTCRLSKQQTEENRHQLLWSSEAVEPGNKTGEMHDATYCLTSLISWALDQPNLVFPWTLCLQVGAYLLIFFVGKDYCRLDIVDNHWIVMVVKWVQWTK